MVCPTLRTPGRADLRRIFRAASLICIIAFDAGHLAAQWRVEGWLGDAFSLPTPATFSQVGQPDIHVNAHWSTRPGAPTWYYAGRIARWTGDAGWAFEYIHHKIYLDNPPADVEYFQVTNGVNFMLGERLWRRHGWEFGVGAGPLYAVPVSSVRGLVYNNAHGIFHSQYELAGLGVQGNLARRLRLLPFTYGSLSLNVTGGYLHVHIANGHAVTTNFALHVQYGLSLQSKAR
jgi:hypothetical protein